MRTPFRQFLLGLSLCGIGDARIIAFVPVLVTGDSQKDIDAGRNLAAEQLSLYETIPSYQRVIAREGVDNVAEIAAIGSSDVVARQLQNYLDAGATDVVLSPLDRSDSADREAVWAVTASM